MEKKGYISPAVETVKVEEESLVCASIKAASVDNWDSMSDDEKPAVDEEKNIWTD